MPAVIICCFLVFFLIDLCWQNSLGLGQWQQMHVNHYNSTTFSEVESGLSRSCGFTTKVVPEPFQHLLAVLALPSPPGKRWRENWPSVLGSRFGNNNLAPRAHLPISDASSWVSPSEHCLGQGACPFTMLLHVVRIYDCTQIRLCPSLDIGEALQDLP